MKLYMYFIKFQKIKRVWDNFREDYSTPALFAGFMVTIFGNFFW